MSVPGAHLNNYANHEIRYLQNFKLVILIFIFLKLTHNFYQIRIILAGDFLVGNFLLGNFPGGLDMGMGWI